MNKKVMKIAVAGLCICVICGASTLLWTRSHKGSENVTKPQVVSNTEYKKIGEEAVSKLGDATADEKYQAKYDAIYQEVFLKEVDTLSEDITVTDQEISDVLNDPSQVKIAKVLILSNDTEEFPYYIYSDETDDYEIGDNLLSYTVKDITSPTEEEQKDSAEKTVKSRKLVDKINSRVEEIIHE